MVDSSKEILSYFTNKITAAKEQQLTELDLSVPHYTNDNYRLQDIPDSIFELTQLEKLNLSYNGLSSLPESINKLRNLTQLDLSYNSLSSLPESITKLTNLIKLELDGNEIETPPIEIVDRGINSIREYFLQLKAGEDYIYEAKFIIIGEAGAGKTILAKKINNPNYELQEDEESTEEEDEESTEGIDIITWKFPLENNNRYFQVNIWDFGGQEIYHATHQFFLTKRSLYALVADTRKENTDFYYWMNVVEILSDNSPLLIIKNEKQDRHRKIDERRLEEEFTNLKETLATNLKTKRGLDEIINNVKYYIQKLAHVGSKLPKTWVAVRKALENNPNDYISLDTYLTICEKNGFNKHENALQLSGYLHDLGVCLHFQEDPVLNIAILRLMRYTILPFTPRKGRF